jgi:hypothetical protein
MEGVKTGDHLAENNSKHPQRVLRALLEVLLTDVMHKLFKHLRRVVANV